ncbi:hypothetical protein ABVK25_009350 [Lepraria finkii]|uniref:Uncharacterized protein n=1 Tax=Lepraria finkii TaxID=1340010 RepID=A0ABR4B3K9_9LECA
MHRQDVKLMIPPTDLHSRQKKSESNILAVFPQTLRPDLNLPAISPHTSIHLRRMRSSVLMVPLARVRSSVSMGPSLRMVRMGFTRGPSLCVVVMLVRQSGSGDLSLLGLDHGETQGG